VGFLRVSRRLQARVGYAAGWALVIAGVFVAAGLSGALIVAGLVTAASFLLLYDVEGGSHSEPPAVGIAPRSFDPTL
jgi:hypothetical protein